MQLDDSLLGEIESVAEHRRLSAGEVLVVAGEVDDHVYVLVTGELVVYLSPDGSEAEVSRIPPRTLVGEISAIAGGPRTATVRASVDSEVLALSVRDFAAWLDAHQEQAAQIVTEARRRFDQLHAVQMIAALAGSEDSAVATALAPQIGIIRVDAGDVVFERGTTADEAFLVVSGRIELTPEDGPPYLVGRGAFLGMDALFESVPRAATARATRDATLACLRRDDLNRVARSEPRVLLLAARAAVAAIRRSPVSARPVNIGVLVTAPVDAAALVDVFFDEIARHGSAIRLDSAIVDEALGRPGIAQAALDSVGLPRLNEYLHELELEHDHVVRQTDVELTGWTRRSLLHADRVLIVCSAEPDDDEVRRIDAARAVLVSKTHQPLWIGVLHPPETDIPRGTARLMDRFGAAKAMHAPLGDEAALRRWARLTSGHGVGLVLSGGGARGFAHIGVFRAMCELGIPVDTIGGASIGGPIGAAMTLGHSPDEVEENIKKQFHRLMDYTLPLTSLLKGRRISERLRVATAEHDIEDSWIPFYCTSTNLTQSRVEVHRRGDAATALRATVAIPGVLPPVPYKGDLLIDGGVLENLPARQMRDDGSIGTVIAVDVAPPLGPRAEVDYGHSISGWRAFAGRMRGRSPSPPIGVVLMRTMLVASLLDRNSLVADRVIDLHLELDVRGVNLLDFGRVKDVSRAGYDLALPPLREWLESSAVAARWRRPEAVLHP